MTIHNISDPSLVPVLDALRHHEPVIIGCDTVWGFIAPATPKAIRRLCAIKRQPLDKPFIFLLARPADVSHYAHIAYPIYQDWIHTLWPGPISMIFRAKPKASPCIAPHHQPTIALRIPNAPHLLSLMTALHAPLITTSLNYHGEPALTDPFTIPDAMKRDCQLICTDFTPPESLASTLVDCTSKTPRILRYGSVLPPVQ